MPDESSAGLQLDLRRSYGEFTLQVCTEIPARGVTGIFGPSGSGKTTLLRAIAGFEPEASGILRFAGETWADSANGLHLAAHCRPVGYVFQDARLFRHLDVAGNLTFAARRTQERDPGPDMEAVVRSLNLGELLSRNVATLSGGEQQRVALGRTLLAKPRLLLLDEPLAALDIGSKGEIIPYLESLHEQFGIPVLYVSHAIDEVARLADTVIVLEAGRIVGQGETVEVLNSLQTPARFETASIIEATVVRQLPDLHLSELDFHGQTLFVPELRQHDLHDTVRLHVRAGDVSIARTRPRKTSIQNILKGRLHDIVLSSDSAFVTAVIDIKGSMLRSHITRQAMIALDLAAGEEIFAMLKTATFDDRAPPLPVSGKPR